jgi:DNA repair exonuclease SbcCD nuclease subunit
MTDEIRVLLLADTHLGFDLPRRPRVERRRRGDDFFRNYRRALEPALSGAVDLVVHGGDLLFRSKVWPGLVADAFEPLFAVADAGVPVFVVPGNHERSAIPYGLLARHPAVRIFDRPRGFRHTVERVGLVVELIGFPCVRDGIRDRFGKLLGQAMDGSTGADVRLLCLHQTVEGASVGPVGYTFRGGPDVIAGRQLPGGFAAVLAGHIHRAQLLERDLSGRRLAAPWVYPGSIERTSFAERDEPKGYYRLRCGGDRRVGGRLLGATFVELPARPQIEIAVELPAGDRDRQEAEIARQLARLDPDSVVRIRLEGPAGAGPPFSIGAARLRELAPPTMNVSLGRPRVGSRVDGP